MIRNGLNDWMRSGLIQKLFGGGATYAIDYLKNYTIRGWNTAVDNQYLTILMNFGLVGEVLFLYLAYKIATITLKAKNSKIEFWGINMYFNAYFNFFLRNVIMDNDNNVIYIVSVYVRKRNKAGKWIRIMRRNLLFV